MRVEGALTQFRIDGNEPSACTNRISCLILKWYKIKKRPHAYTDRSAVSFSDHVSVVVMN
jgi:hypothetical protein